jgi:tripartite-type tricarboxylate transporter receptor subunit TctC
MEDLMYRVHVKTLTAILLTSVLVVVSAPAQDFPTKPIRVLIGPSSDVTLRLFAERMQGLIGQPMVVEQRPGAGGEVAAKVASAAEPDGHTLLYATSAYTLNTALGFAGYDFVKEFEPISLFGISSFTLLVHPSVPARTVEELIALAKEKPGTLNCGSSGIGTPAHLGCEMFNALAGVKTEHVPFRNVAAAVTALLGGHVHMIFGVSINGRPQIESGKLRGLAVTTPKPVGVAPGLPTMDSILPGFIITGWGALVAPAGTPKPVIAKLNAAVTSILKDPVFGPTIAERTGQELPEIYSPEEFRVFIREDIDRWNRLIDQSGISRGKS